MLKNPNWGNANQNHNEQPPQFYQHDYYQKDKK